jgi:hypothetical protein
MKREKRKVNHESTKVPFDYAPFDLAQGLRQDRRRHERKHERRGVYLDTLALFRAFVMSLLLFYSDLAVGLWPTAES